jgi:hypothetical protein
MVVFAGQSHASLVREVQQVNECRWRGSGKRRGSLPQRRIVEERNFLKPDGKEEERRPARLTPRRPARVAVPQKM